MRKPAIVKERERNAKKLTMKNVLNDQKYEILQNSKILQSKSKLQGEIFKLAKFCNKAIILESSNRDDFFYPNWQGTKLIINYFQLLTSIIPKRLKIKTSSFQKWKAQSFFCFHFKGHICYCKSLEITRRSVEAMKKENFCTLKKKCPYRVIGEENIEKRKR